MFDFWKFYNGLLNRKNLFDNYWNQFPEGRHLSFKKETLALLNKSIQSRDTIGLSNTLAVIYRDGADADYTEILLSLLDQDWHTSEEDVVGILEQIKDPKSINKLYEVAIKIPDYDDMRALAKKCIWALSAINTSESIEKLKLLQMFDDPIVRENATFQLDDNFNEN